LSFYAKSIKIKKLICKENKFKATPKLILFYPKINSLTPNEKPTQNYFFLPQKYFIFYPKNNSREEVQEIRTMIKTFYNIFYIIFTL